MSKTQFDVLMMAFTLFGIVFLALTAGFLIAHSGGMGGFAGGYAGNYPAPPTDPHRPDSNVVPAIAEPHYVLLPGLSQMLMIAGPDAGGRMHLLDQMGLDVTAGLLGQGIDVDRLLADAPQLYISGSTDEDGRTLDYMPAGYLTGDEQSFIPSGLLTDGESYYLNTEFAYGGQLGDMYGAEPLAVLDGNGYADLSGFDPELVDGDWQYLGEMAQLEDHGGESGYSEGFDEGESGES